MRMKSFLPGFLCLLLISGCAKLSSSEKGTTLQPRKDWRVIPEMVGAPTGSESLRVLRDGESATWQTRLLIGQKFAVKLPSDRENPVMVTYRYPERGAEFEVRCETSTDSTDGNDGSWQPFATTRPGMFLEKFIVDPAEGDWVRLVIVPNTDADRTKTINLQDIGLYDIDPNGRNDYWVVLGASIQWQSIRQEIFHEMVKERYPEYDPVIFNEAVSGWTTTNLKNRLPGFLEEHQYASYMPIHIGGNNVSGGRPYPGGADRLQSELEDILVMIRAEGKEPILSRLSYRAYKASGDKPAVPPEENGSGPYVKNIYDPMIKTYCPLFYDYVEDRGMVDAYNWFKNHQDELSTDGIHVNDEGKISWNRLWVENAGKVVYGE